MPASFTHQQFGNQVLTKIDDPKISTMIKNNLDYYNLGLQGPDILFFYRPLKSNYVNALGNRMHQEIATEFFSNAKKLINNEAMMAYIFGFINHFILDSECHHYVDQTMTNKNISHYAIERDLDCRLMQINQVSFNSYPAKSIKINKKMATTIAPFFNLRDETIYSSLKYFKMINWLFFCKSDLKRKIIIKGMTLAKAKTYTDMVILKQPEAKITDDINHLIDLFNNAINIAAKEIIGYYQFLIDKQEISNRFNYNYE